MNKKKVVVFISQPMRDKTENEIIKERIRMIANVGRLFPNKSIDVIASYNPDFATKHPVWSLGRSISMMSKADVVAFVKGWENNRGCRCEYKVAQEYSKMIVVDSYEKENKDQHI